MRFMMLLIPLGYETALLDVQFDPGHGTGSSSISVSLP